MSRPQHMEHRTPPPGTDRKLWYVWLGGPIAWSLAHLVSVSALGRTCTDPNLSPLQWALSMSIVVAAILVTIGCIVVAFRVFKDRTGDESLYASEGWDRVEFMAQFGFIANAILLVNIVMFGATPLIISSCMGAAAP